MSNKIAFKVVDDIKNSSEIEKIFEYASRYDFPVEACFYKGFPQLLLSMFEKYSINNPTLHTNHYKFDLGSMIEKPENKYKLLEILSNELNLAEKIGAKKIIIHPHRFPFPRKISAQKVAIQMLINEIGGISEMLKSFSITAYIENTFDEASFYRALFEEIKGNNIENFGFCFDIGHAKVWSCGDFSHWMRLLYDLEDMHISLHSHLHSNDGVFDEHMPFIPSVLESLRQQDDFLNKSYAEALKQLFLSFPKATFTAEVKPHVAIENMKILRKLYE